MDKELLKKVKKKKTKKERKEILEEEKSELDTGEETVNGGENNEPENPDSEYPYKNNWYSSFGFVCNGVVECSQ